MATIANLLVSLGLDSRDFERSIDNVNKKSGLLSKTIGTVGKVAAGIASGVGAAASAAGAAAMSFANKADEIDKAAIKAGVGAEALQELRFAMGQVGVEQSQLQRGLERLTQRMGRAADGNEKYQKALERLGISMDEIKNGTISTDEAFMRAIQSLHEIDDATERAALAGELFGTRLGRQLLPAIEAGGEEIEKLRERAHELGIVLDEEAIKAGVQFSDTWDQVKRMMGSVRDQIGVAVLPIFQRFLEFILDNMPLIRETFTTVFDVIRSIIEKLAEWVGSAIDVISGWVSSTDFSLGAIRDLFFERLVMIGEIVSGLLEWIREFWDQHGERITSIVSTAFDTVRNIVTTILEDVVPFVQEQLDRIRVFWDENGEQIMQAVENAFAFIQAVIETVMPIIQAVIETAWEVIKQIFDSAIGIIMGLVQIFAGLLTGDFEAIKEGLISLWESLWDLIKGIVATAWDNLLKPAFSALWNTISGWFEDLKNSAIEWGKGMIEGFIDGIKSMFGAVGEAASGAIETAKRFLGFASPAEEGEGRFIEDWGANMLKGFMDGMKRQVPELERMMRQLIPAMDSMLVPAARAAGAAQAETITRHETFNFERMFEGANIYVRDERDIQAIAEELYDLIESRGRGGGLK